LALECHWPDHDRFGAFFNSEENELPQQVCRPASWRFPYALGFQPLKHNATRLIGHRFGHRFFCLVVDNLAILRHVALPPADIHDSVTLLCWADLSLHGLPGMGAYLAKHTQLLLVYALHN